MRKSLVFLVSFCTVLVFCSCMTVGKLEYKTGDTRSVSIDPKVITEKNNDITEYISNNDPDYIENFDTNEHGWMTIDNEKIERKIIKSECYEMKLKNNAFSSDGFELPGAGIYANSAIEFEVKIGDMGRWAFATRQNNENQTHIDLSSNNEGDIWFNSKIGEKANTYINGYKSKSVKSGDYNKYLVISNGNVYSIYVNDNPYCYIETKEDIVNGQYVFGIFGEMKPVVEIRNIRIWELK
jgi:hypothetical protein